jgi:hypothetical protein
MSVALGPQKEMTMRNRLFPFAAAGALLAGLLLLSSSARADAIAPDEEACNQKTAGADCVINGAAGHCAAKTCTRLDYSDGSPPGSKQVDCFVCVETGVADAASPPSNKDSGTGSNTNPGDSGTSGATTTSSNGNAENDDGGCSLAAAPIARSVGPWLLAILPMALLRKRSRKQR